MATAERFRVFHHQGQIPSVACAGHLPGEDAGNSGPVGDAGGDRFFGSLRMTLGSWGTKINRA